MPSADNIKALHQLETPKVVLKIADCLEACLFLQEEIIMGNRGVTSVRNNVEEWLNVYLRELHSQGVDGIKKLTLNAVDLTEIVSHELDLAACVVRENR